MDLTGTKAVVLVLLGLIKLFSGLAPLIFTRILKKRNDKILKKFIGVVLCFGGGILLSTVLIHMLGEVRESLERATDLGMIPKTVEYPFAELLVGMGFLLILLIESVVHKFFGGQHGHSHFPSEETFARRIVSTENSTEGIDNTGYEVEAAPPKETCNVYNVSGSGYKSYSSDSDSSSTETSKMEIQRKRNEKKVLASLRSFLVVLALSIHSLFEGMAIGLEETDAGVWKLLLAVSIHAIPIVFCMGTDMISSGVKKIRIIVYMIILSVNTPIGILIGILVTAHMEEASGQHILVIGILQGLAAGTLLYITFYEVLARDKLTKYGMSGLVGALAVMVGFTVMAGMEAQGGHSHGGHSHGHHIGHPQHMPVSDTLHPHEHIHEDHNHDDDHHDHHIHDENNHEDHHIHEDDHHGDHNHNEEHHEDHIHEDDHHDHHIHEDDHHEDHNHDEDHHEDHIHEEDHEDHIHEDDHIHDKKEELHEDSESDILSAQTEEYFVYNVTDYKFMHDNIAYD